MAFLLPLRDSSSLLFRRFFALKPASNFVVKKSNTLAEMDKETRAQVKKLQEIYGIGGTYDPKKEIKLFPSTLSMIREDMDIFTDPLLKKPEIVVRPYPLLNPKDTYGKDAVFRVLDVIYRNKFDRHTLEEMKKKKYIPISLTGGTPLIKGHNTMHFFISKKVIMKEIGETGIYCRMFKFNIDTSEAAADEMEKIGRESSTIAIIRHIDAKPVKLDCDSVMFGRFIPGRPVKIKVPIQYVNAKSCRGVKSGGVLLYLKHNLVCEFVGDAIPTFEDIHIKIDLANVGVDNAVRTTELTLPKGLSFVEGARDLVLVTCKKAQLDLKASKEEE